VTPPVEPVILAVPNVAEAIVDTFTDSVPIEAVLTEIVPSVLVPVEDIKPVAKVVTPLIVGIVAVLIVAVLIVAVLIVAVLIVAVLIVAVPIVTVPVVAEMLEPKVAAPVTARLEAKVVAPTELSVPLELTPSVEICSAETDDSSPVAIATSVLVNGVLPDTFNN
jgi:hypothetical protein